MDAEFVGRVATDRRTRESRDASVADYLMWSHNDNIDLSTPVLRLRASVASAVSQPEVGDIPSAAALV